MNKIPTAEEFLLKHVKNPDLTSNFTEILIKFAKLHVEAALKTANEHVELEGDEGSDFTGIYVNKDSILNAYSLENIK
jgi:hypothetical protein